MNQTTQTQQQINLDEIQSILDQFKNKEEEIKKGIYELQVHKDLIGKNLEQQKQVILQNFETDNIEELQNIKSGLENQLNLKIAEIKQFLENDKAEV